MAQRQSVWVKTLAGHIVRSDRISTVVVERLPRKGWAVIGVMGRGEHAGLAAFGRGAKAKDGAQRLCNEWPQAVAAARKDAEGRAITFVKNGYPKGEGQWSSLAAAVAPVQKIPAVQPDESRQRRQDIG